LLKQILREVGAVALLLAAVLAEIYLCSVSSCQELLRRTAARQAGGPAVQGEGASLQRLALWVAASTPNVDVVLSGCRRMGYVRDLEVVRRHIMRSHVPQPAR
jgi:hypothetical protein